MTSGGLLARCAAAAAVAALFPIGSEARSETGAWAEAGRARARLIAATAATGHARSVQLGLEIKLDPGWKTYWRSPGEGGMPPRFDWNGSKNLGQINIVWPAPKRFEIGGLESAGYADHVILPLDIALADPGKPLAVRLQLHYAVCREVCMLVESRLALDLPADAAEETQATAGHARAIAQFRARAPRAGESFAWRITEVRGARTDGAGPDGRDVVVIDVANGGQPFAAPELLIEGPPGLRFGKADVKLEREGRSARFVAPVNATGAAAQGSAGLVLTLIDAGRAGNFRVRFEPPAR